VFAERKKEMLKLSARYWGKIYLAFFMVICTTHSLAQGDVNSQIEALRADLRADKTKIIADAMQFSPKESSAFWPIYKKYEADLSKLNDEQIQLIKSYAEKFTNLSDGEARAMAEKSFDLDGRRVELKKKYFNEFTKHLPATTVAKFFQLEHRLDLLIGLKVASELPSLLVKPAASPEGAAK
jgi:hypothetical protein